MHKMARGLASLGRNKDTELVHMTKGEVRGLKSLAKTHGGSLTINPHTGLLEAGFLSRVLPMVAAIAATAMYGPAAGAAVNGAMTYAKTGDIGKSALSAGMSYGLGQAAEGLEGMGQTANTSIIQDSIIQDSIIDQAAAQGIAPGEVASEMSQGFKPEYSPKVTDAFNSQSSRLGNISAGAKQLGSMAGIKDLYGRMSPIGLAGLGAGALQLGGAFTQKPTVMPAGSAIASSFNPNARRTTPVGLPGQNAPTDSSERRYFAGDYPYAAGGSVPDENQLYPMARGGLASLGEYAVGGTLLDGEGDGMSDSIPAVIKGDKPQRAALAQGEFVIPADVVSHLGNGATKAGSQRLYAMMDRVRHARTGTKKQGRRIKPEQFLPA